ncbi:RNA polymerase sigma factor, partial [Bacteroidota bacterium]
YKIVYNTAISRIRKKSLETEDIANEITDKEIIIEANSVVSSLKNEEQKKYLNIALDRLEETESLLLTLFYYNENSIEEISEITGITSGNVKTKLFRARKKMYIELEDILSFELKAIV